VSTLEVVGDSTTRLPLCPESPGGTGAPRVCIMDSARRHRSRSHSRNPLRARSQPAIPWAWEETPVLPYATHARNYSITARDAASPVSQHGTGTPGPSFSGSSEIRDPKFRATPPPAASMNTVDSSGNSRGGRAAPSPSPVAGKSKRVRTGCLTCRERHLKCDEGVPECNNCRKSNRECRRGIRLNFIDIQVRDPPCLPPTGDWSGSFPWLARVLTLPRRDRLTTRYGMC
jgi:hypothetical protein